MKPKADIKAILAEIQRRQLRTFCSLSEFLDEDCPGYLQPGRRGLYWIWTKLSFDQLGKIETKSKTQQVPIEKLVHERRKLANIASGKNEGGFWIVYNGIGGYKETTLSSRGLRGRILQEFTANNNRTGSLNLSGRSGRPYNEGDWAVSYFDFDDEKNSKFVEQNEIKYRDAKDLEMNWRIEYGTPILTRH